MREKLKKIGLGDEEINIYISLLKLACAKVTTISKDISMARSSVYRFIQTLMEKGLVAETIENNVKVYTPTPPEQITKILMDRVLEIESIIPELNKIHNKKEEDTKVLLFKGKDGVKTIMNEILKEGKEYTCFGNIQKYFEKMDLYTRKWMKEIERKGIKGHLISSRGDKNKIAKTEEIKYMAPEYISDIVTVTYGNKTALFIWSNPLYVILIENQNITKSNLKTFNFMWKQI